MRIIVALLVLSLTGCATAPCRGLECKLRAEGAAWAKSAKFTRVEQCMGDDDLAVSFVEGCVRYVQKNNP